MRAPHRLNVMQAAALIRVSKVHYDEVAEKSFCQNH